MKRILSILTVGFLALVPAYAMAEDAAAPAAAMTEAAAPAAAMTEAPAAKEVKLLDGTVVTIEGDMAFVHDASGTKVAAPDGDHDLSDNTVLTVKDGKVVTSTATEAAPAAEESHEGHEGAAQ